MKITSLKNIIPVAAFAIAAFGVSSCTGDLDVENINPQQKATSNYDAVLNKVYANLVLTGQTGPDGNKDIEGIDEGASSFIRQMWNANELPTDEAHCKWGDAGIPEFNHDSWTDSHPMMKALYYRLYFGITCANFYLDQTSDADAAEKRAEARFMRAYYYSQLMDLYGNVPMITTVTKDLAKQASRAEMFAFIEKELKAIDGEDASSAEVLEDKAPAYGRASKVAAWMLLSRIYLNAKVYTGTAQWENAKTYADKVIKSSYSLCTTAKNGYTPFQLLFMGDNDTNGAQNEIILPAVHDGLTTQTWGGCLFIIASTTNAAILADYPTGTAQNWGGNHCRKQFVEKFFPTDNIISDIPTNVAKAANDDRALFFSKDHTISITDESNFNSGEAYVKFTNIHADGTAAHDDGDRFADTDFPIMRVAEAYLTYAEADARLNNDICTTDGISKINALRTRAEAKTVTSFSLDDILDEWSREFGFEGRRRVDLVRFGKFGGQSSYKWQWEGGAEEGQSFDAHYNIFPIPVSDLNANNNLKQNLGY